MERNEAYWYKRQLINMDGKKTNSCVLTCSCCGHTMSHVHYPYKYHYCPNCGSKMTIVLREIKAIDK